MGTLIDPILVNARSRVVKVTRFLSPTNINNKISYLKNFGQGGQGGQGNFSPITRARAYFLLLFLKSSFLKKSIDHLDQTNTGAGFHPDHSPSPALTTLTKPKKEKKTMSTAFDLLNEKYGTPVAPVALAAQDIQEYDAAEKMGALVHVMAPAILDPDHQDMENWKDSEPVVMLSAFLKEFNNQGFSLQVTREGQPTLSFDPGLTTRDHDPERWDLVLHLRHLFTQALPDLQTLISQGLINLKQNYWI